MLYDRWLQIAQQRPTQVALIDLAAGRRWTFAELTAASSSGPAPARFSFPAGNGSEFVIAVLRAWRYRQVLCPLEPGQTAPAVAPNLPADIAHLKTTSATTGLPRVVAFTAPQLIADADNIVRTMGLRPEWPNLGVISLAHSYGFSSLVLPLLLHGIPLVLVGSSLPEALRRAAAEQPAVTLAAVPALWRAWQAAHSIPPQVALAISAGAPLPLALEQEVFAEVGLKIHNFYGSSECGGIAYDASPEPRTDASCVGAPMRNVTVSVGADGCLEVRSAAVGETYWPEPSPRLGQRVFRTNDLGEVGKGMVFLRGRAGDLINVAGRKVSPETVERVLATHPLVQECLVFGVPSPDLQRGENIVACLSARPGLSAEALKHFALTRLPAWQVPREWWFVESLKANARGKLSRADWRQQFLASKTPPAE